MLSAYLTCHALYVLLCRTTCGEHIANHTDQFLPPPATAVPGSSKKTSGRWLAALAMVTTGKTGSFLPPSHLTNKKRKTSSSTHPTHPHPAHHSPHMAVSWRSGDRPVDHLRHTWWAGHKLQNRTHPHHHWTILQHHIQHHPTDPSTDPPQGAARDPSTAATWRPAIRRSARRRRRAAASARRSRCPPARPLGSGGSM